MEQTVLADGQEKHGTYFRVHACRLMSQPQITLIDMRVDPEITKVGMKTIYVYCYTGDRLILQFYMELGKPFTVNTMLGKAKERIQGFEEMALSEECMVKCSRFDTYEDLAANRPNNDPSCWKASGTAAAQNPYFVKF